MAASNRVKVSPEVRRLIRFWIKAFRLDNWRVQFRKGAESEFEDSRAFVNFMANEKSATVTLRDLACADERLEEDVVHELLHLLFVENSLRHSEHELADCLDFEFAINTVGDLLVKMRRAFEAGYRIESPPPAKRAARAGRSTKRRN